MPKPLVVNGGLMRGQTAHWRLKGGTFVAEVQTAPRYRLYSLDDRYPGLLRDEERGVTIRSELYELSDELWAKVVAGEPPGLYCGEIELADGRVVPGILGEASYVARYGADISEYGGWAAYPRRARTVLAEMDPQATGFALFVNGTLMRGLQLHANLQGAPFLGERRTEPRYRIHSIGDLHPGMYRLDEGEPGGIGVPGELYFLSDEIWAAVEAGEPAGLYRGQVVLHDGSEVWGILYPRELAEGQHPDISAYGGWRGYLASKASET
jgi:gamma-glutamylcyclotransferase (GGCT)/AIG2-like uncharacterized protein YtfP